MDFHGIEVSGVMAGRRGNFLRFFDSDLEVTSSGAGFQPASGRALALKKERGLQSASAYAKGGDWKPMTSVSSHREAG